MANARGALERRVRACKSIFHVIVVLFLVFSVVQVVPFQEPLMQSASAGSSWVQTTEADFLAGTGENIVITPEGNISLALETKYVEDDFIDESMIASKRNVIIDTDDDEVRMDKINKTFGGSAFDIGQSIKETTNGGFIIAGYTSSYGHGGEDVWLIKTDSNGNELWNKTYGNDQSDRGYSVNLTSDGGFIIVGNTSSYGNGGSDIWLIKTNETGSEQWNRTFGTGYNDVGLSVQQTTDGGYIISGNKGTASGSNIWCIKTDSLGYEQWNRSISFKYGGQCIKQTDDGGYILTGYSSWMGDQSVYLAKLNSSGNYTWTNTYNAGSEDENGYSVEQTDDGGYIVIGNTDSVGAGNNDIWLVKVDTEGNKTWSRTFGGSSSDYGRSVKQTTDGGYILTGYTYSLSKGSSDVIVIKTDSFGNETWTKLFGGLSADSGYDIQITSNSSFIITGVTSSFGAGSSDAWLIKTDSWVNGTWDKTYGGYQYEEGKVVQQTSDGGYIIMGTTNSTGYGGMDILLIKTNETGYDQWNRTFGGSSDDNGYAIIQTADSGYIICGNTESFGAGGSDAWLIKTNKTGVEQWNKTLGSSSTDKAMSFKQTTDGGYIIAGYTYLNAQKKYDVWLIKTNETGSEHWNNTYGGTSNDKAHDVLQTDNGEYIIVGETLSYGPGIPSYPNLWLIKTNETGIQQWNITKGGSEGDYGEQILETSDGGFIIAGCTENYGVHTSRWNAWLLKTTPTGSTEWYKAYGGWYDDYSRSIRKSLDGGFIISGETESYSKGRDFWLIKTDSIGSLIWKKVFGNIQDDYSTYVSLTSDSGYISTGSTNSHGAGSQDIWLIRDNTPRGELLSKNLLSGDTAYSINNITCDVASPCNTIIKIQISLDKTYWYNSTGSLNGWDILNHGSNFINLSILGWNGSKFYYRINFYSDRIDSPVLHNINFFYNRYFSIGYIESQAHDSTGESFWQKIYWNGTTPKDTAVKFQLRSAPTQGGLTLENFVGPDGTISSYYSINGTSIWTGHSNDRWMQYKAFLNTSNTMLTPILEDVTISYNRIPTLNAFQPVNNTITKDSTPDFGWAFLDDSTQNSYCIVIDDDINFNSIDYTYAPIPPDTSGFFSPGSPISDGVWYWRMMVQDTEGNWSNWCQYRKLTIDTNAPEPPTNLSVDPSSWTSYNDFDVFWSNPPDLAGISGVYYRIGSPPSSNTNGTYIAGVGINSIINISVPGIGNHSIYIWLNDSLGNVNYLNYSKTNLYYRISEPESPIGLTAIPPGWSSTNLFDLSWTNPAHPLGIAGAYVKLDSEPSSNDDGTYYSVTNISEINGITVPSEGNHSVYVWLKDGEGFTNYKNHSITYLHYDATPPEAPSGISVNPSTWTNTNSFTISWTNPSDLSGIAGVYYNRNSTVNSDTDGTFVAGADITSLNGISVGSEGENTYRIWLVDNAGNVDHHTNVSVKLYYDGTPPDTPTIFSKTHKEDTWVNNNDPEFNWSKLIDLSGIVGYSYILDKNPTTIPDNSINSSLNVTSYTDIPDGIWYFHVKAQDNATSWGTTDHYKIKIDLNAPDTPTIQSDTHPEDTWVNQNIPTFKWNEPSDGSGIEGYSFMLDQSPSSMPDDVVESSATIKSYASKADGTWYFHIKAKDNVGKWGGADHYKIKIDTTPPGKPEISSTEHPNNTWTIDNNPEMKWTIGNDQSGIAGYSYVLDQEAATIPDTNSEGSDASVSFTDKPDSTWYFHVRAVDGAGNWGPADHYTIKIDVNAPSASAAFVLIDEGLEFSNDYDLDIEWGSFSDIDGSGITGYYYSFTNNEGTSNGMWTTDENGTLNAIAEGYYTVHVWARDFVGNIGLAANATITVKLPIVVDLTKSIDEVYRTDTIIFKSHAFDPVEPESDLACEFQYQKEGGSWLPLTGEYVTGTGGNRWQASYKPTADVELGLYKIRVRYTNSNGVSTSWKTDSFTVLNNNPVINMVNTTFIGNEDIDLIINLSLYESDTEDQASNLQWTTASYDSTKIIDLHHSPLTIHHLTLSPSPDWFGKTYIDLILTDTDGGTDLINFTLIWESVNDAPIVNPITDFNILEDHTDSTTVDLKNVFDDVDTTDLEYSVSDNSKITVTINPDGTVLFVPAANWSGAETIIFKASDKIASPVSDAVVVTITAVNDKPVAIINTTIDTAVLGKKFLLEGSGDDIDGEIVEYYWLSSIDLRIFNSSTLDTSTLSYGTHTLSFSVKDNEGAWSDPVAIVFTITTPDLKVSDVKLSTDDITDGDEVTITATVENTGDADAGDITVTFYDGDKKIGSKSIDSLATNASTEVSVSWKPDMGDHSLRVEVDVIDEDITDGNTEDNTLSKLMNVKRNWTPWIIMIIIIAIIIMILAFIFARSMKERREKNKVISDMEAELEKARELGLPTAKLERMLRETKKLGKAKKAEEKPMKPEKEVDEDIEEDEMKEEPKAQRKKKHK